MVRQPVRRHRRRRGRAAQAARSARPAATRARVRRLPQRLEGGLQPVRPVRRRAGQARAAVGPEAPNRRPDVAKVETFLGHTGHLDLGKTEGPTGYYGSRVDAGIRGFQRDNALRIDGLINPNGPTLQRIGATLSEDLGDGARSSPAPGGAQTFAPLKDRTGIALDTVAASTLIDRVSDWLGRKASLKQNDTASTPLYSRGTAPEASSVSPDPDSPRTKLASPARAEPASENNGAGRSAAPLEQAQANHTGAWFEGGPIPGGVTYDDPVGAEKYMRGKVESWRREGLNDAADNLQRYLDGKGGIVPLSRDDARKFEHVRDGEEENRDRFVNRTFLARRTSNKSALRLRDMQDGDEINFQDNWDSTFDFSDVAYSYLLGDANFALAYGVNNLKSNGEFTAKRQGDRITIEGVVRQTWKEPYDFERGQPGAAEGHTLERHGKARPYQSIAEWEQPVRAVVRIRNGRLHDVESVKWGESHDLRKARPE